MLGAGLRTGLSLSVLARWFHVLRTSGAAAGASPAPVGVFTMTLRGSRGAEFARKVPYTVALRGLFAESIGPRVGPGVLALGAGAGEEGVAAAGEEGAELTTTFGLDGCDIGL